MPDSFTAPKEDGVADEDEEEERVVETDADVDESCALEENSTSVTLYQPYL